MLRKPCGVDAQLSWAVWGAAGRGAWPQGHVGSVEVLPDRLLVEQVQSRAANTQPNALPGQLLQMPWTV